VTIEREWTRRLAWEGVLNARDLGGYPAAGGRETRWGAVVRSDSLGDLTAAGQAALAGYGVRAIVDLRLADEIARHPNPFASPGDHGVAYTNVSVIDPAAGFPPDTDTLAGNYLWMLDQFRGFVAEAIAAEDAMTAELLRPRDEAWLAAAPPEERAEREALLARYAPRAEVMLEVLAGLEERYGGVEGYLLAAGVSRADLERLRERLVAPAGRDPGR
jgi:protein-tyrosine phosphatase